MWFYVEQIDNEIIIPEGVYPIDYSDDYGSVLAADGSLGRTFYATHDGEYFTSFYFLVDGTVTISKKNGKLSFEVQALNSYDVPVHIIYESSATSAVENITTEQTNSQKKMINGQMMIIRNGKKYNVLGSSIE
jgi:hypothetical protein